MTSFLTTPFRVSERNYAPHTVRLFLYCLYTWLLINTLLLLPQHKLFWSPTAPIPLAIEPFLASWWNVFNLLRYPLVDRYYLWFISGQIIALCGALRYINNRWWRLAILLLTMNLDNRAYLILDGGNNLVHLMLIYALFLSTHSFQNQTRQPACLAFSHACSNTALFLMRGQVVAIYFVAGVSKVLGDQWQNGTALYYTLNVDEYTLPTVQYIISHFDIVGVVGTYFTVCFQLAFPWLVWFPQTRRVILLLGTLLHLQISITMGLFMFGLAMTMSYVAFFDDHRSATVLERFRKLFLLQRRISFAAVPRKC